ncbi:hypothetical protein ACVOMV_18035 [Mesorhizobium atlanticum]
MAAVDYLKSGHTGFVDPGTIFSPDAVASVSEEFGIRVWLTDAYVADAGEELKRHFPELASDSFLARWPKNRDEALRAPWLSTCSATRIGTVGSGHLSAFMAKARTPLSFFALLSTWHASTACRCRSIWAIRRCYIVGGIRDRHQHDGAHA